MIKLSSKGLLPEELHDPVEDQVNQIPDGKKFFLASYLSKVKGVKEDQNLYL